MISRPSKIVLAGGSGFLGRTAARWFSSRGWEVVVLSRRAGNVDGAGRVAQWDGRTIGPWAGELDGAAAVLNLAGRSVNCRYTAANRKLMLDSRTESTRIIGRAIQDCVSPPPVWLNLSTATIYKHTFGRPMDESGEIGATPEAKDAFSIEVATNWERALFEAQTPGTRKLALRTAMVFGLEHGGVFEVLRRLTRFRLGGAMAGGRQYVSWIHEQDFCRAVEWLIQRPDIDGIVNLAAPNPLTNGEMMAALRRACGVRIGLPAARWMLEIGAFFLRTETELIIKSRRVGPGRLVKVGFEFQFPELTGALMELEQRAKRPAGFAA